MIAYAKFNEFLTMGYFLKFYIFHRYLFEYPTMPLSQVTGNCLTCPEQDLHPGGR